MINAIIIEDEELAGIRLQKMIQGIDESIVISKHISSVRNAILYLNDHTPDLIFMDIDLSDGYCFEIFEELKVNSPIIFTTAYSEYAIKAFEQNSLSYLLKPVNRTELEKAIIKFKAYAHNPNPDYAELLKNSESKFYRKRFLIKMNKALVIVDIEDIAYFYSEDRITFLVNTDGKRYPLTQSLKELERELDPADFYRINRQFIIRNSAVEKMYYTSKSRIRIIVKPHYATTPIIVAVEKTGAFKSWLTG